MSSQVEISNLALLRIGATSFISSPTENTPAAKACNLVFNVCRDIVLSEANWQFARREKTLALVTADPVERWAYAYMHPTEALKIWKIVPDASTPDLVIPYEIAYGDTGRHIYTDQEDAIAMYTYKITDPERFPAPFVSALAWRIGMEIAPSQSKVKGAADNCYQQYMLEKSVADEMDANQQQTDGDGFQSEFLSSRL